MYGSIPSGLKVWWMSYVRARWLCSLQDVLKSYTLHKSSLINTRGTCINKWSHFEHNLNICRPHQGAECASISWEFSAAIQVNLARTVMSVFPEFYGSVWKYVCQTWVKYHLQIIIGVCFNFLQVPDGGFAAGWLKQCQVNFKLPSRLTWLPLLHSVCHPMRNIQVAH